MDNTKILFSYSKSMYIYLWWRYVSDMALNKSTWIIYQQIMEIRIVLDNVIWTCFFVHHFECIENATQIFVDIFNSNFVW